MKDKVLTAADLKRINASLHANSELAMELERAAQAGIEVEEYRQRSEHQRDRLMKIKQAYFPLER